jgi:hypothetical protein
VPAGLLRSCIHRGCLPSYSATTLPESTAPALCHLDRSGPGFPTSRCLRRPRVRLSLKRAACRSSKPRVSTGNPGERSGEISVQRSFRGNVPPYLPLTNDGCPISPKSFVGSLICMRFSLMKGADAALSRAAYRKFGVSARFWQMWDSEDLAPDCAGSHGLREL